MSTGFPSSWTHLVESENRNNNNNLISLSSYEIQHVFKSTQIGRKNSKEMLVWFTPSEYDIESVIDMAREAIVC